MSLIETKVVPRVPQAKKSGVLVHTVFCIEETAWPCIEKYRAIGFN
jgi:hypothetical protein